jgi:hypothetical protein
LTDFTTFRRHVFSVPILRHALEDQHLSKRFGIDAFCEAHPFVEREKPDFPGWALAYVAGQWHLADDYAIDDDEEEDGSPKPPGPLKLIRPVVMPW